MRLASVVSLLAFCWAIAAIDSTQGLYDLVKRRLPSHSEDFIFALRVHAAASTTSSDPNNDEYAISVSSNGSIAIQGNSLSALTAGLHRYFTDVAHVDLYWFIGSRLDQIQSPLPRPNGTITGRSIVPWRYFFNTGISTFNPSSIYYFRSLLLLLSNLLEDEFLYAGVPCFTFFSHSKYHGIMTSVIYIIKHYRIFYNLPKSPNIGQ